MQPSGRRKSQERQGEHEPNQQELGRYEFSWGRLIVSFGLSIGFSTAAYLILRFVFGIKI